MLLTLLQKCANMGNTFAFDADSASHASSAFPSSVEAACLQHIQMSGTTKFDKDCDKHMALLHTIWNSWYSLDDETQEPATPPDVEMPSKLWRRIGFQHENPVSDIRGGAELSIVNLAYFAKTYPHTMMELRQAKNRRYREMKNEIPSYPIAPAGINITRLLAEIFNLLEPMSGAPKWFCQERLPYYRFMTAEAPHDSEARPTGPDYFKIGEKAFNELYCFVFQYLDQKWDLQEASYMDFNRILKEVKEDMVGLLSSAPPHAGLWWLRLQTGLFINAKDFTPFSKANATPKCKPELLAPTAQSCDHSGSVVATINPVPVQPNAGGMDLIGLELYKTPYAGAHTHKRGGMILRTTAL